MQAGELFSLKSGNHNWDELGNLLMGQIAVILDTQAKVQHAVYMSYDIAARSNAKLIGVGILERQSLEEAEKAMNEFTIGVRAARTRARTVLVQFLTIEAIREEIPEVDMLILASETLAQNPAGTDFLEKSPWPVWLISGQRSIHRALAVLQGDPAHSAALAAALDLSRRWRIDLYAQAIRLPAGDAATLARTSWLQSPVFQADQFDQVALNQLMEENDIDLVMIDRPILASAGWQISCCAPRVMAIYPPSTNPPVGA